VDYWVQLLIWYTIGMRKRYIFLIVTWFLVLILGSIFVFISIKKKNEVEKLLCVTNMNINDDPIIVRLLQEVQTTDLSESTESTKKANNNETASKDTNDYFLTSDQKKVAEQLTSLFENGKTEIQYSYAENLDDGRGITAGRAGFTTRDGDAYMVVRVYCKAQEGNKLEKYLVRLKELAEKGSDSTKGLSGYTKAWKEEAKNSEFRDAQDYVVDKLYFQPSQKYADELGLKTAIARAFLYDTIIQHGDGDDKDSLRALIKSTNKKMEGSPKDGVDELKWFEEFMKVRKEVLSDADDESTRDEWAESVGRVDVYKQIFKDENYDLKTPIKIKTDEYDVTIS
jgi:chitosanase